PRPGSTTPPDPTYYGDSAVIAFRTPADESNMTQGHPQATTNAGPVNGTPLWDDDLNSALTIAPPANGGPAWVQYEFAQPFKARAISIAGRGGIPVGRVLASDDGVDFRTLVTMPGPQLYRGGVARTYAFAETTAKFYRIELTGAPLSPAAVMSQAPSAPAREYILMEAMLHSGARVHRWQEKAGFSFLFEYESVPTPPAPSSSIIPRSDIVDLSAKMNKDGTLNWDVPEGRWTIMRFGYSL